MEEETTAPIQSHMVATAMAEPLAKCVRQDVEAGAAISPNRLYPGVASAGTTTKVFNELAVLIETT